MTNDKLVLHLKVALIVVYINFEHVPQNLRTLGQREWQRLDAIGIESEFCGRCQSFTLGDYE
jgi:hypothetical protein